MKKEIICGIYKITSPTGRIYVGKGLDIYKRIKVYKYANCKSQPLLFNSIKKHGWESHIVEIIEVCDSDKINEREIYWINHLEAYKTNIKGMNCTFGGEGVSKIWNEDEKLLQSMRQKGLRKGKANGMFGRGHSKETKNLQKQIWHERRNSAKYNSIESKQKRSESRKGNKNNFGKSLKETTKNKISDKLKIIYSNKENHPRYNKSLSEESKSKISKSLKEYYQSLKERKNEQFS